MAVDLKSAGLVRVESFVIRDDCLVILERETTSDRMRKMFFDRVESVVVWRAFPWRRALIGGVLTALPAAGFAAGAATARVDWEILAFFAIFFAAVFLIMELRYLIDFKTHIRITRDGATKEIVVIVGPGKVRRFVRRLCGNIRAVQEAAHAASASKPEP